MRLSRWSAVSALAACLAAVGLPGCGDGCGLGYQPGTQECITEGTASAVLATSSPGEPPQPVRIVGGKTCVAGTGCDYGPSFGVATEGELVSQAELSVRFNLPPNVPSGSFTLPSPKVQIRGTFRGQPLQVVSGTIVITRATEAGVISPFDVVLATSDGTQLTLSGEADVTSCRYRDAMCVAV